MKTKKQNEAQQKAYDFWMERIEKSKGDPHIYLAGCQWMIDYWTKKMTE